MTITASLILFAVTWFMVFFIILPLRVTSQAEAGHVEPGTPRSAPLGLCSGEKGPINNFGCDHRLGSFGRNYNFKYHYNPRY